MGSGIVRGFYKGLDDIFARGDIKTAEAASNYIEIWLKTARANNDLELELAACNELGGVCRVSGRQDEAKKLYERALEILAVLRLNDTDDHAVTLINAGDVYIFTGEYEKALEYFLQAGSILESLDMDGDYRMAALYNNISMAYRYQGRLAEAESALNRAFDIIKGLPKCRQEMATTLVNLGELQLKQKKYTMSEESFLHAVRIYERELGGRDVHLPSAYSGLGNLYYLTGRKNDAESAYVKALAIIEAQFGKNEAYNILSKNLEIVRRSA